MGVTKDVQISQPIDTTKIGFISVTGIEEPAIHSQTGEVRELSEFNLDTADGCSECHGTGVINSFRVSGKLVKVLCKCVSLKTEK